MPNNANGNGNQSTNGSNNSNPNQGQNNGQGQGNSNQSQNNGQGNTMNLYTEDQVMQLIQRDAAAMEEAKENSRMWMSAALVGTALMRFAPHPGVKALGFGLTLASLAKASRSLDGE